MTTNKRKELSILANSVHCLIQELENGFRIGESDYMLIYEYLEITREYFENKGESK